MSILYPAFISLLLFFIGYVWYAKKLVKVWQVQENTEVPAHTKYDGLDYVPSKHWIMLFGHHFSSIAGAAPIVGPIIAISFWGWIPSIIWIVLGAIFMGGVHDFGSLITSVREGGTTIGDVSSSVLSNKARILFLIFLWLTLILIVSVFVHLCAKTFVQKPEVVLPSWGLIIVALVVGFLLYRVKVNTFFVTIIGLFGLVFFILLGNKIPLVLGYKPVLLWTVILLFYSLIASITPVNILLQPRDYISAYLLFSGIFFGFAGLIISNPEVSFTTSIEFNSSSGPLWPILFVTIACGAISGFHSLVASGTTSKQLSNEIDSKKIGYGGMITEGILSVLTLLVVIVTFSDFQSLSVRLKEVTPIGVFGEAFGNSTKNLLGSYGGIFAIIILNAFIFTTLDTATRIGRYITQELFNIKSNFFASFIVIIFSGFLALSGQWIKIWPLFGAANQLVAAFTLIVLTAWLLNKGKTIRYTIWPAVFMLLTTVGALVYQLTNFFKEKSILLSVFAIALLILSGLMLDESRRIYIKIKRGKEK